MTLLRCDEHPVCHAGYSAVLERVVQYDAFGAGIADIKIVTTLCPGGKERMQRLIAMVQSGRLDLHPLITHRFRLSHLTEAYALFGNRLDGVIKVAVRP